MSLSQRLRMVCSFIDLEHCQTVVDVGYDHGQVMHWAVEQGMPVVYGVEMAEHFHQTYRNRYPDDAVNFLTGNGLSQFDPATKLDCLIFSGLGEEQIRDILMARPDVWEHGQHIIFCPSSIDHQLRPYLNQQGWMMRREQIVEDRGRLYVISLAIRGQELNQDREQCAMGPRLFEGEHPLLPRYLEFVKRRFHHE